MVSGTIDFGIEPDASTGVSGRGGSIRQFVNKGVRLPVRRSLGFLTPNSLLKNLPTRSHPERSGGGKAGAAQSKDPVKFTHEVLGKPDGCWIRGPSAMPRDPSTPRRAACAHRGAPLRMTHVFRVFQQAPNAIQTGHVADEFRIPMLRGKHGRAERNHLDITLFMEVSGQVRMQAYIPSLDEERDITFNPLMSHKSRAEVRAEYAGLRLRMAFLREKVDMLESVRIHSVLARVEGERFDSKSLIAAAENDADAVQHLNRRLREFAAALDDLEFLPKRAQHREAAVVVAHDNENPEQQ